MKHLLVSFCLLWLACSADAIDVSSMTEKQIKDHAHELFTQEKYQEAIDFCNFVLAHNPKSPSAYYIKGRVFFRLDRVEQAIWFFDKALEFNINPSGNTHYYKAMALETIGRDSDAEKEYDLAVKNDMGQFQIYSCTSYLRTSQSDKIAMMFCDNILKNSPQNPEAHFQKGRILHSSNNIEGAIMHYKKAIEYNKEMIGNVYYHLGMAYEESDNFANALDAYQTAIERGYDHRDVYQREASLQFKLGIQPGVQSP